MCIEGVHCFPNRLESPTARNGMAIHNRTGVNLTAQVNIAIDRPTCPNTKETGSQTCKTVRTIYLLPLNKTQ